MQVAGVLVLSYLIGAVPSGLLVVKAFLGVDIRQYGSGNVGTINVFRLGGVPLAVVVLAADVLKGLLAVELAQYLGFSPILVVAAGLLAIAGHNWSVFLSFGGGKGVATTVGVLLGLAAGVGLLVAATWLLVVLLTRISSLGSMSGVVLSPLYMWLLGQPPEYFWFAVIAAVFVVYRHKENIRRLLEGKELKINEKIDTGKK